MTTNLGHEALTLTLSIPSSVVELLRSSSSRNFMDQQPGRFLALGEGSLPAPDSPVFNSGTLIWTNCVTDALILRAYEEAAGESVTLLWDDCGDEFYGGLVVLTSRPIEG
jgi:hypothetical protein